MNLSEMEEKVSQYWICRDKLLMDLIGFLPDYKFPLDSEINIVPWVSSDSVAGNHNHFYGPEFCKKISSGCNNLYSHYFWKGTLLLNSFKKDIKEITDSDIKTALKDGQAISIMDLKFDGIIWLFSQLKRSGSD
jgi:hypothetical protein